MDEISSKALNPHGVTILTFAGSSSPGGTRAAIRHLNLSTTYAALRVLDPELCASRLPRELVTEELTLHEGILNPPSKLGLGVGLVPDTLEEFERAAARLSQ